MAVRPKIDGALVLVTGASSGIGAELARQLAPRAKTLVLVARRAEKLLELKTELQKQSPTLSVHVFACDVSRTDDIDRMLSQVRSEAGEIDILINNAGLGDIAFFENSEWPKLAQMISVNVVGLTYLTRQVLGPMIERGKGGILMVGSTAGMQALPGFGVYSATKHYVRGFSDALRAEVAPVGVAVTQLCPGPVKTEFLSVAVGGHPKDRVSAGDVPDFVQISAKSCASAALRGFERGKAVVIPGLLIDIVMAVQAMSPKPVLRLFLSLMARASRPRLTDKNQRG